MRLPSNSGNPSASVSQMLNLTPPCPTPFPLKSISFFLSPNLMSAVSPQSMQFLFWPRLCSFFFPDFLSKVINHSKAQWEQYLVPKVRWAQTLSTSQRTLNPLENQPTETLLFKEHLKMAYCRNVICSTAFLSRKKHSCDYEYIKWGMWHMLIPGHRKLKQEDRHEFMVCLGDTAGSRPSEWDLIPKHKEKIITKPVIS